MNRNTSLSKHISDMLATEEHILEAVVRQRDDEKVKNNVEVNKHIIEIERVLKEHTAALKSLAKQYNVNAEPIAKEAVTKLLGIAAGLYDKMRGKHPLSRDLRDNYTALSLAAMAYTQLHTYGLAIEEQKIATLAEQHLKDLTPLMVQTSKLLPNVTAHEIAEQSDFPVDTSVGKQATDNTQKAWSKDVTESAATT